MAISNEERDALVGIPSEYVSTEAQDRENITWFVHASSEEAQSTEEFKDRLCVMVRAYELKHPMHTLLGGVQGAAKFGITIH